MGCLFFSVRAQGWLFLSLCEAAGRLAGLRSAELKRKDAPLGGSSSCLTHSARGEGMLFPISAVIYCWGKSFSTLPLVSGLPLRRQSGTGTAVSNHPSCCALSIVTSDVQLQERNSSQTRWNFRSSLQKRERAQCTLRTTVVPNSRGGTPITVLSKKRKRNEYSESFMYKYYLIVV